MIYFSSMKKLVRVLAAFFGVILIVFGILFVISNLQTRGAGISVETTPASTVFVNGEQVGHTPYEGVFEPGEIVVKLVPDSFEKPLATYETKITLASDVQTVVKREFGETEDLSSGAIISFEKVSKAETGISVISTPDGAQVSLDSQVRGFTPFKSASLLEGEHTLVLSAPGYTDRSFSVRVISGYRITSIIKLSPNLTGEVEEKKEEVLPEPVVNREQVEILDTGTGFLRVRESTSTGAAEVARVEPGQKFPLLERDPVTGWFKIEYEVAQGNTPAKVGWVTNQFARIVASSSTSSSSPSPIPSSSPRN